MSIAFFDVVKRSRKGSFLSTRFLLFHAYPTSPDHRAARRLPLRRLRSSPRSPLRRRSTSSFDHYRAQVSARALTRENSMSEFQTRANPSTPKPRSRPFAHARVVRLSLCYFHAGARRRAAVASQSATLHIEGPKVRYIRNFLIHIKIGDSTMFARTNSIIC